MRVTALVHRRALLQDAGAAARAVFGIVSAAVLLGVVAPSEARAQGGASAEQVAADFAADLAVTAERGQRDAMASFLAERVDLPHAFEAAFEPIAAITNAQQQARLGELMTLMLADEARLMMDAARGGQFQITGSRQVQEGRLVEGTFRDGAGDYPFAILVGVQAGQMAVLDLGSPRQSSVVTRLSYVTSALAQASTDPEIWIAAFEQVLSVQGNRSQP